MTDESTEQRDELERITEPVTVEQRDELNSRNWWRAHPLGEGVRLRVRGAASRVGAASRLEGAMNLTVNEARALANDLLAAAATAAEYERRASE